MKQYKIGILGATGAVGQEMMKILVERNFPISELRPIASERRASIWCWAPQRTTSPSAMLTPL